MNILDLKKSKCFIITKHSSELNTSKCQLTTIIVRIKMHLWCYVQTQHLNWCLVLFYPSYYSLPIIPMHYILIICCMYTGGSNIFPFTLYCFVFVVIWLPLLLCVLEEQKAFVYIETHLHCSYSQYIYQYGCGFIYIWAKYHKL